MVTTICLHICPICGEEAPSPHHIVPRAEGGTDDPANIVHLCKGCHDIVEEVHDRTGQLFSPRLVKEIQRDYNIRPVHVCTIVRKSVLLAPGETPWWKIADKEERNKANMRQRKRMLARNVPKRKRRSFSILRDKLLQASNFSTQKVTWVAS